ncbi:8491_t:CDS:2 [Funneliformis mosseae]|uniref:8491_t:CDS:1 n=1 Tax=Funneliformis mosseae TaxID=27381 RepID=A0A9N9G6M6_FUNMO|nr:8491_t:CDS:2 [Funneliformis mosseae]
MVDVNEVTEFNLRGTITILVTSTISNLAVVLSIGFMLSYNWVIKGVIEPGIYCDIQGFLINLGDISSGFWVFVICLHTYIQLIHEREYPHTVFLSMITIWPFNIGCYKNMYCTVG